MYINEIELCQETYSFCLAGTQRSTYVNVLGANLFYIQYILFKKISFIFNYVSRCVSGQACVLECSTHRGPGFPRVTGCFELLNDGSGN